MKNAVARKATKRDVRTPTGHPRAFDPRSYGLRACPRNERTRKQIASLLRSRGDGLPEPVIAAATSKANARQWTAWCDRGGKLASAVRVEPTDWYLCTLKNAVTHGDFEGRGIGSAIYSTAAHRALRDKQANPGAFCKVITGDIRESNIGSVIAAQRSGLKKIGSFCWDRDSEPETIWQYAANPGRPAPGMTGKAACQNATAGRAKRRRP